ncbi:MAG: glycosyltransferase family 39 protein [Chitinophagaceae bacterium]
MNLKKTIPFTITPLRLILLLTLMQLVVALFTNSLTFTHEESMWHYIGRNWLRHGLVPYAGGVDNKSPLIYFIFGLSDRLFGINYWFPRLLGSVVEAAGVYYLFRIAKHIAGYRAGIFAISVYGLSLLWKTTGGKLVSFTETYACTAVIISFYYCLSAEKNKHYFISGLFAGIALAFRLTSFFGILAILLVLIRRKLPATGAFIAGGAIALGVLFAAMLLAGINMELMIHNMLTDNFGSGSTTDHSWAWKMDIFSSNFFDSEFVLFYPFVIGYLFFERKINWLVAWLICTFIGINVLGIYARPHFKELLPSLSLMSAFALAHLTETYKISYKGLLVVVWICFFPKLLEPFWGLKKTIRPVPPVAACTPDLLQSDEAGEKQLGKWVKENTKETDQVFVAGYGARVQVYSERLSPTIYFNVTQTSEAKNQLYKDLEANKPAMMIVPAFSNYKKFVGSDIRDFIEKVIARDYVWERCLYGYGIYRLK